MTPAAARLRFHIASDQFDREMEKLFRANDFRIVDPAELPTLTLRYWDAVMRNMLATNWKGGAK